MVYIIILIMLINHLLHHSLVDYTFVILINMSTYFALTDGLIYMLSQ